MEEMHRKGMEWGVHRASMPSMGTPPAHHLDVFTNPETL